MDRHRLAEARSRAYHRVVARRLATDPALLRRARERIHAALACDPAPYWAREWAALLARPVNEIARILEDEGEHANELRQSTPFAGALTPRERWALWRTVAATTA